tara:strand:+ start:228 stop:707 length:480 start_codon:yes stop_codon:yes gene_type:complete
MKKTNDLFKFRNKINDEKDFPKIKTIPKKLHKSWGIGKFVMPSPLEVNSLMKKVSKGKLTTINQLREILAKKYKTTTACPIVTGIFVWITAYAAEEELKEGKKRVTPYWRTLKSNGIINEKYPGGIVAQKKILKLEGHTILHKGKNYIVENYQNKLLII